MFRKCDTTFVPVIAVKLSDRVFAQITRLVSGGTYETPAQFLEIAAFNQLALEEGAAPASLGRTAPSSLESPPLLPTDGAARPGTRPSPERAAPKLVRFADSKPSKPLEDAIGRFSLSSLDRGLPVALVAKPRSVDERPWVQFNRVFGLKVACRWLAAASAGSAQWPDLATCTDKMIPDVAELGSALEVADRRQARRRDELLATGLPRRRNPASCDRFLAQTIARTTRTGAVYPGAILQYALAVLDGDRLALTERACALARLRNPILDGDIEDASSTLTPDEQNLLLEQVVQFVPGECADYRALLAAIRHGKATPDELVTVMRDLAPSDWSDQVVRSHVAGTIGRMAELGLVRRHWEGRRVRYELNGSEGAPL